MSGVKKEKLLNRKQLNLPENVRRLPEGETFHFGCHPGVPCFTECCRQLDLALTPYDVLRLSKRLSLSGDGFLARYAVIEYAGGEAFPQVYLGMVDDGRASCPFVSEKGCAVYEDRPGACRAYPLGRGSFVDCHGRQREMHVLLTEPHCHGFAEAAIHTSQEWQTAQGLADYNAMNDRLLVLLQHRRLKAGWRPDPAQSELYLDSLYRLEKFKSQALAGQLPELEAITGELPQEETDDQAFLLSAITWLHHVFFGR